MNGCDFVPKRPEVVDASAGDSLAVDGMFNELIFVDSPYDRVVPYLGEFCQFRRPHPRLKQSVRGNEAMEPHVRHDTLSGICEVKGGLHMAVTRTCHERFCPKECGNGNSEVGSSGPFASFCRRPDISTNSVSSLESCQRVKDGSSEIPPDVLINRVEERRGAGVLGAFEAVITRQGNWLSKTAWVADLGSNQLSHGFIEEGVHASTRPDACTSRIS